MEAAATTRWFMDTVFGLAVTEAALISVWTVPGKRTKFFSETEKAAEHASLEAGTREVYTGVGLYRPRITKGRGKAEDVVCIPGLWADIDFGEGHKKKVPPDQAIAEDLLKSVGILPSIIVHSGHGLHAYWLFKEPMPAQDGAAALARRWGATLLAVARARGYVLDAVHDLSRVLRPPGTVNRKSDHVPVALLTDPSGETVRYDPGDIEAWCVDDRFNEGNPVSLTHVEPVTPSIAVSPEIQRKIQMLTGNDDQFGQTYARKRGDEHTPGDCGDCSPSAYDLSLANQAVAAGWTDQEITELIGAFRAHHNLDPPKAMRRKYIQGTIGKAREGYAAQQAIGMLEYATGPTDQDPHNPDRLSIIRLLSAALGVRIARWVQDGLEDALYTLFVVDRHTDDEGQPVTGERGILIGDADAVCAQSKFLYRIYEATGHREPWMKEPQWRELTNKLGSIVELKENLETNRINRITTWIEGYLEKARVHTSEDREKAAYGKHPFQHEGLLYLSREPLFDFIHFRERGVSLRFVTGCLRAAGFTPRTVPAVIDGRPRTSRYYWCGELGVV